MIDSKHQPRRRSGQTMIFLLALVVILSFVVLWNFDLHRIITVKMRSRHASDAAALAAARWQGITLNLVGHLNVMQAVAVSDALIRGETEFPEAEALADLRARLAFVGPMTGLSAAQQAARLNGLFNRAAYARELHDHAGRVRTEYALRFAPPYINHPSPPTAWDDYAGMIEAVASEGLAASPDNMRYYARYSDHHHLLLNPGFYDAIASLDWCWFRFHAHQWLEQYQSWQDWPALPAIDEEHPAGAEYFALGLQVWTTPGGISGGETGEILAQFERLIGYVIEPATLQAGVDWTAYDPNAWTSWHDFLPVRFPFAGEIRPEADVVGADAVVLTEAESRRTTPGGGRDTVMTSAAAKPFGRLSAADPPHRFGMVLPAFQTVRLIPVDSATGSARGSWPGWTEHVYDHLPVYLQEGPEGLSAGCGYCAQLRRWEDELFRAAGIEWLDRFGHTCVQPSGPGGPGGGTRRGH